MKHNKPSVRVIAILSALSAGLALPSSADEAAIEPEVNGKRTCRILFPDRPREVPSKAYLYDGKKSHKVTLPSMNFSEVLPLPGGPLTLALTAGEIKEAKSLPPEAPTLAIDTDTKDFYILLAPDSSNPEIGIKMSLIRTGEGTLKPGETRWLNHTDHRITASLGGNELTLGPNEEAVSSAPVEASGYYTAEFKYQREARGNILKITEQQWWHDMKSRHLGIISHTSGRLPKLFIYRDFRAPN